MLTAEPYALTQPHRSDAVVAARQSGSPLDWLRRRRATTRRALLHRLAEAERAALTDSLTGLYNRDGFTFAANKFLTEATETRRPVAVFLSDLNNFGEINNSLLHATGDALLGVAGQILADTTRGEGVVARLGGDEFAGVLMPDATSPVFDRTVRHLVAEFHNRLAEATNDWFGTPVHTSTGIAAAHPDTRPAALSAALPQLLGAADAAMYDAKPGGSNGSGIAFYPAGLPLPRVDNQPAVRTRDLNPTTNSVTHPAGMAAAPGRSGG